MRPDVSVSELWETVEGRVVWHVTVRRVGHDLASEQRQQCKKQFLSW